MRALLQRVSSATVTVGGTVSGQIGPGLLILLGIEEADTQEDIDWLCGKITRLRIFPDEDDKMNLNIKDVDGELLVVSQFTLFASTKKGNRPGFTRSARPESAIPKYEDFVKTLSFVALRPVETGEFGAMMQVGLVNEGPTTIWLDSKAKE